MEELMKPTEKEIILNSIARNRQVIHGQRATNFNLNSNLRRETKDYDILTKKPKESAEELVKELNKHYKDKYEVTPALHRGTFKVKDKKTGDTIVDYTKTTKKPFAYNEFGIRYANLDYTKRKLVKLVNNKESNFRNEKDKDMLSRIKKQRSLKW